MNFLRRILNWQQSFGVFMLANAALLALLWFFQPSLQMAAFAGFSLWMGWRFWTVGSALTKTRDTTA